MGSERPIEEAYTAFLDVPMINLPPIHVIYAEPRASRHGTLWVSPAGIDKSSIMVSIKDADCLIWLPAGGSGYQRGDGVYKYYTTK